MFSKIKMGIVKNKRIYYSIKLSDGLVYRMVRAYARKKELKKQNIAWPLKPQSDRIPTSITVETTNICNTKCSFCPHNKMKRKLQHMDMSLFTKVIEDAADNNIKNITLSFFGEPLTDPQLFERIKYCRKKNFTHVTFFSNCMLLNKEISKKIVTSGLTTLVVSLDAATPETFKKIRFNGDYNKVIKNLKELVKLRNKYNKDLIIEMTIKQLGESDKEIDMFIKFWKEQGVNDISVGRIHDWADKDIKKKFNLNNKKLNLPCLALWTNFIVLSDGKVVPCCIDYDGTLSYADMTKQTIREAWNSKKILELRRLHIKNKAKDISLCSRCNIAQSTTNPWWYYR
jgi:radical SAM protein with 4Fe4S-binding SPASM domain